MFTKFNQNKIVLFFFYFISLQPILDILTTIGIVQFHTSATMGVLFRMLYMVLCLIFLLAHFRQHAFAKYAIYYFFIWGVFLLFNLGINYSAKPHFNVMEEVKLVAKLTYFNVMLIHFVYLFENFSKKLSLSKVFVRNIMISGTIIGAVMLISIMTGTSLESYAGLKIGYSGWFFAGNEIGAVQAVIFPILLFYALIKTKNSKSLYNWIPAILIGYSLIMLGTKVGYGALVVALLISFVSTLIALWRKQLGFGNLKLNSIILLLLLIITAVITPYTPVVNNMTIHLDRIDKNEKEGYINAPESYQEAQEENGINRSEELALSGRQVFLDDHIDYYMEAPTSQKLFGMGWASNYQEEPKIVEMDYFDAFFSLGILGTILYFLPFLYFTIRIIKNLLTKITTVFLPEKALWTSSILLGLGIAGFAGHVLNAPSVTIYLAPIMAYFYLLSKKEENLH